MADLVSITVRCGYGHTNTVGSKNYAFRGDCGCCGGHGDDDYCYCDSRSVVLEYTCPSCANIDRYQEIAL